MDILSSNNKSIDISVFPKSIFFSFYTSKEKRNLSCTEIFCPVFFDIHGNMIRGGLCDEKMGISSKFGICKFCKSNYTTCPGHFGNIDLPIPVSNNFLRNVLFIILRAKCLFCSYFKTENFNTILSFCYFLKINLKIKKNYNDQNFVFFGEKYRGISSIFPKTTSFKVFQQMQKKKIDLNYHRSIRKKIRISKTHRNYEKYENFPKEISLFLFKCKDSLKCQKCTFSYQNKQTNKLSLNTMSRFFKKGQNLSYLYTKISPYLKISWITGSNEKILFSDKLHNFKDSLVFQFKEELENLWKFENNFCELIWGKFSVCKKFKKINGSHLFYIDSLLIPPNRFRPFNSLEKSSSDNSILTNPQNFYYSKILKSNQLILLALAIEGKKVVLNFGKKSYLNLEGAINNLGDSTANKSNKKKENPSGIKQQLEKKNGIFRMHLMGKRVFHSARSIIIPDPFLRCNEIGIPFKFSNQLTLPEEINSLNFGFFVNHILIGLNNQSKFQSSYEIENFIGDRLRIENDTLWSRKRNFLKLCHKHSRIFFFKKKYLYGLNKVFRNLINGDIVLANRQPSLHRVSMMSHKIMIEKNSKCIKLNYCNCNSYNADFDGDEMNIHIPQNFFAKTESKLLSLCSNHFKIPVNDSPTRGLIQDYIISSVILTRKDTFFNSHLITHLLYFSENFEKFSKLNFYPAILKPIQLWTGKQLISILWKSFCNKKKFKVLESRTKFSKLSFGLDETKVLMRKGELLRGIMDNSQLGKNKFGALHSYYEIYGGEMGDFLLSEIGSILIIFLRIIGFTLNIEDLILLSKVEKFRLIGIRKTNSISQIYSRKFLSSYGLCCFKNNNAKENMSPYLFFRFIFFINNLFPKLIQTQKSFVLNLFSKNLENCIPGGLYLKPYFNKFSTITLSGAKGSTLNTFQLSLNLGQTELESKCIPRNIAGKTLPIFLPFDLNVSSNGFISNRFVTGINQSEFFFHCMAGREGLLDTAVKTSQSGYIQRSLIKHLESISMNYDYSVRFSRGQINQFIYSRDACCPMISDLKSNLNWKLQNFHKKKPFYPILNSKAGRFKKKDICFFFPNRMNSLPRIESDRLKIILKKNKNLRKIHPILKNIEILTEKTWEIFYENLAIPGDALGVLTSQSLGEPCTQMTLNTFHFAGKLESNQKSGVPRLKEILLLSSKFPVTPTMSGKILGNISLKKFSLLQKRFKPIHLNHILTSSSSYFEKNKYFEGQIFRFFFPKIFFFKHLLSINMNSLKESIEIFVTKFKKLMPKHSKKTILKKISNKPNHINHNNEKIKFEKYKNNFCSNNKKWIKNKCSFLKINLSQDHYFLDCQDIDILLGKNFILKTIKGISDCFIDSREKILHVNGINFLTFWKNFDIIDAQKIYTNDVYGMLINYGIEASRNCLFNELESIFKIQGISISVKHFDFIADYMTRLGNFRGFNRKGFNEEDGFQEITYETAINYILNSSHSSKTDYLTTISSRLCLGIPPNLGTSCFGITF